MKYLIDTNVLVSAALFPNGITAQAYAKAVSPPNKSVVCEYSMEELKKVFHEKFPDKLDVYENFKDKLENAVEIILTPPDDEAITLESKVRDVKDQPILRSAVKGKVNAIITGDKDFLESGINRPQIIRPTDFVENKSAKIIQFK
jgi:putative PIN family toxin of toxin-antitoxin system